MLLTAQRRVLASRWFAAGAVAAAIVVMPNAAWQAAHGFPMWELLRNGANGKNVVASPPIFIVQQLLLTNIFTAPIWIVGLIWLIVRPPARFLGYAYVLLIAMMVALHAKHYYPADVYPIVMAAGGVAIEGWTQRLAPLRAAIALATLAAGILFAPFSLPVLSETSMICTRQLSVAALHISHAALATNATNVRAAGGLGRHDDGRNSWRRSRACTTRSHPSSARRPQS